MKSKLKKRTKWILGIVAFLVLIHILLPFVLVHYVNKTLKDLPGYTGNVEWIHVNLLRGAYKIHQIEIEKKESDITTPFFDAKAIDLSVEWKALFHGEIAGEIIIEQANLNFIGTQDSTQETMSGEDVDWTEPIKELMPLKINRFEIINSNISYLDPYAEPKVDIYLNDLNALVTNLSNVTDSNDPLPSKLNIKATSLGNGQLSLSGGVNIIKKLADWDLDLKFENVDLTAFNDFILAYGKADLEKGTLNLYSEISGKDGELTGYIKPLLSDIQFIDWEKEKKKPLKLFWESILGGVSELFENQKKDQLGTKVPIEGSYENISPKIWKTIGGVFRNAFIRAFRLKTDDSVDFADLSSDS